MAKKFIGIQKLWYGDSITEAVTQSVLSTWLASATNVPNSHQDTFTYEQDDPDITDYINELTGTSYHRDKTTQGEKRINWTSGEYDYQMRADLEGGTVSNDGTTYAAPTTLKIINKAVVGLFKTGNYVVFTNASIVAKTDTQEKALGLGVTATAQDSGVEGVSDMYLVDGDGVVVPTSLSTLSAKTTSSKKAAE